jgi:hypothetical protein
MDEPELVGLFADFDAQRFVETLIERGIERHCLRDMRRKFMRDPMCDAHVAREPTAALDPYLSKQTCHFLIMLDHHGSGYEKDSREKLEEDVVDRLVRSGVDRQRVAVIVFEPELEVALIPVWNRVLDLLAAKSTHLQKEIPLDPKDPKSSLKDALVHYQLRSGSALFGELAKKLSLKHLKTGDALGRIARVLVDWFGAP